MHNVHLLPVLLIKGVHKLCQSLVSYMYLWHLNNNFRLPVCLSRCDSVRPLHLCISSSWKLSSSVPIVVAFHGYFLLKNSMHNLGNPEIWISFINVPFNAKFSLINIRMIFSSLRFFMWQLTCDIKQCCPITLRETGLKLFIGSILGMFGITFYQSRNLHSEKFKLSIVNW